MSLRARLVIVTFLVGGIGLLGLNVTVYRFVRSNLAQRLDDHVRAVSTRFGPERFDAAPRRTERTDRPADGAAATDQPPFAAVTPAVGSNRPAASAGSVAAPARRFRAGRPRPLGVPAGEIYSELRDTTGKRLGAPRVFSLETNKLQLTLPRTLPAPRVTGTYFTVSGTGGSATHYRAGYFSVTTPDGRKFNLLTALPASELRSTLDRLRTIQSLVTLAVLVAIATGAWLLVRVSLRPLESIERAAGTIAAGDLSHRIANDDPRTELGRLGGSLNRMMVQIESAFAEKQASQEQLRRFVADASHELRTPLTAIRGYAQLHRRANGGHDRDTDRTVARIEEASTRMSGIVEDLLTLARQEKGVQLADDRVILDEVIDSVVSDARAIAPGRRIRSNAERADPVLAVRGDRDRLHQAIMNLVDNARLHGSESGAIDIDLRCTAGNAVIAVSNEGADITAHDLTRLFDPFYRVDPSRSRHSGGAGLGLTIAASTIALHGGTIAVASADGLTTFSISLPVVTPDSDSDATTDSSGVSSPPLRVL